MKPVPQAVLFATAFVSLWLLLSRLDLVGLFGVQEFGRENERRLGELVLETVTALRPELEADSALGPTEEILELLCRANGIADTSVRLTMLADGAVNAFALPDRRIVVYSGLVAWCETPEELAGVLAHELAHVEGGHVMKKLIRETGFAMLLVVAGGRGGGEILRETARTLSSTAFDREQEREADSSGGRMMAAAGCDPEHLANFLHRLSRSGREIPRALEWLSTHPDASDRAAEIMRRREGLDLRVRPIADSASWARYRRSVALAAAP